jgi:uncharacterized protein (DUF4415 family)
MPRAKEPITIRLDPDLLEWFRKQKGYQTQATQLNVPLIIKHLHRDE